MVFCGLAEFWTFVLACHDALNLKCRCSFEFSRSVACRVLGLGFFPVSIFVVN